jgi:DNA-binding LacI/PurR family transcriptional regulator
MNKKPTIKTIAAIAGVSHVAVSKALRGCSDISKETTEQICQIAKEIGYTPNAFARNLSSKSSNIIGMIVPALGKETAYDDVFNSISVAAAEKGLSVLLGSCNRDIELEKTYCKNMCENRVGALIVGPISSEIDHIKEICKDTVPLIFMGGKVDWDEENSITFDYRHSAKLAIEHLYQLGHRDIALFLYYPNNRTISQKLEGYREIMQEKGLLPKIYWEGHSADTFKAGGVLIEQLIEKKELPTAIWCASDLMAMGAMETLRKHGLNIPNDISIIGHDNLFFSDLTPFSLTTLSMPKEEIGQKAVEMALQIMGHQENPNLEQRVNRAVFHAELVCRQSTGKAKV